MADALIPIRVVRDILAELVLRLEALEAACNAALGTDLDGSIPLHLAEAAKHAALSAAAACGDSDARRTLSARPALGSPAFLFSLDACREAASVRGGGGVFETAEERAP